MNKRRPNGHARRRQRIHTLPFLIGAALATVALAQAPNRLYLDFTEVDYAGGLPIVHLYDNQALTTCIESGGDNECVDAALYRLPFVPVEMAERAVEELEQAYRDLRLGVAREVDAEINNGPPCHSFMICLPGTVTPPVPDLPCLETRKLTGTLKGMAKHLPTYYAEANRIIHTRLPSHIGSGGLIYPGVDSIVAPTLDAFGGLTELISSLTSLQELEDAITAAYRTQSLAAMTGLSTYIPYLPGQVEYEQRAGSQLARPGYRDYEEGKRSSEDLYDPDARRGIFGFGASSLSAHAPDALATGITSRLTSTTGSAAAQSVLGEHLAGLVPQDVIDHLALRVQTTIENAAPDENLKASISNALERGISSMASTLYTEDATAKALAASLNWEAPQPPAPTLGFGEDLSVSSAFLYEHIGYVGFTQITPKDQHTTLIMEDGFIPMPGMWVKCFGVIPTPLKIPIPTAVTFPQVARAAYITVPEGYDVPLTPGGLTKSPAAALFD